MALHLTQYSAGFLIVLLSGCATLTSNTTELSEVRYFAFPKQAPTLKAGEDEIRLTAGVEGKLKLDKNNCLRIGQIIPILHRENIVGNDNKGFFIRHEKGTIKYRLGDKVRGGGGYSASSERFNKFAVNKASVDLCKGKFASFYLSYPK